MLTDLNSEFTHFNLVIRVSKVQQMALRFFRHFEISCCSGCPRDPSVLHSVKGSHAKLSETSFYRSFSFEMKQDLSKYPGRFMPSGVVLFAFRGCLVR